MQKTNMIAGAAIALVASLIAIPVISRGLNSHQLSIATISILAHGMFGIIDLFRPLIVRNISEKEDFATYGNILMPGFFVGISCSFVILLSLIFLDKIYVPIILSVSVSVILFSLYTPLWGVMDGNLRMGTAYFVRSLSVAMLYGFIAIGATLGLYFFTYTSIVITNLITLILFWALSRKFIHRGSFNAGFGYIRQASYLVAQNAFKLANDFGDRVVSSIYLPVSYIGIYNLLSDLGSRVNFPAQLASSYYYPVICRSPQKSSLFLWSGVLFSAILLLFCVILYSAGIGIFVWYLGEEKRSSFPIFCGILACFSNYSQSFFGQSVARSLSLDRALSISFGLSTLFGFIYFIMNVGNFDIYKVIILAMILKSSSVFIFIAIFRYFPAQSLFSIIVTLAIFWFIIGIYIRWSV